MTGIIVFQIGFNRCGTRSIARLFRDSGYRAAHWGKGRLARDLAAALDAGRRPFADRPDRVLFSDLEAVDYDAGRVLEPFRRFAEIDALCPEARFLLNTRDRTDWLYSRLRHRGGRYVRAHAAHLGLRDPRDVLDHWVAAWDAHHAQVERHFANRPGKLVRFAIDRDPVAALCDALAPDLRLDPAAWSCRGGHVRQAA